MRAAIVVLGVLLVSGCAVFGDDAPALLDRGRPVEALAALRAEEPAAAHYGDRKRTRYALYRGLAHLGVGDVDSGSRWLAEAKGRADGDPDALSAEDRGRLLDAWASLGGSR